MCRERWYFLLGLMAAGIILGFALALRGTSGPPPDSESSATIPMRNETLLNPCAVCPANNSNISLIEELVKTHFSSLKNGVTDILNDALRGERHTWKERVDELERQLLDLRESELRLKAQLSELEGILWNKSDRVEDLIGRVESRVEQLLESYGTNTTHSGIEKFNFASLQYGAQFVPNRSSPTLHPVIWNSILDFLTRVDTSSYPIADRGRPRLGDCWCFDGDTGTYTVRLALPAVIEGVVYEHSPWESVGLPPLSAPDHIQIWGCPSDVSDCVHLTDCRYGPPYSQQRVHCLVPPGQHQLVATSVEFRVAGNHGRDYTCIYSIKVHGYRSDVNRGSDAVLLEDFDSVVSNAELRENEVDEEPRGDAEDWEI